LERVTDKFKLWPHIKLQHRISRAQYNEATGKWHLTIRRPKPTSDASKLLFWDWKTDYEEFEDTADVLFAGLGPLNRWSWPEIEGLEGFQGQVIHSAQWETDENGALGQEWEETVKSWGDKRVGVIGVVRFSLISLRVLLTVHEKGSSAIQMVPTLQPRVKRVVNYVRGKTWLSGPFVRERLLSLAKGEPVTNCK
jgi:cation diffusion facilitator CzcD-associated flavoprotein CzcO